jgi:hypothetical protein
MQYQGATMGFMGTILGLFARYIIKIVRCSVLAPRWCDDDGPARVLLLNGERRLAAVLGRQDPPEVQTPYITTLITGGSSRSWLDLFRSAFSGTSQYRTLFAFVIVAIGIMVMR